MKKSAANPQSAIPTVPPNPLENDDWERKIGHLKDAYKSTQEVIRAIDTKSNILIGLSMAVGGLEITLIKWVFSLRPAMLASWSSVCAQNSGYTAIAIVALILSILASFIVVFCCLLSVISRKAGRGNITLLFPVPRQDVISWKSSLAQIWRKSPRQKHHAVVIKAIEALDKAEILAEYAEQLAGVGRILEQKLDHNRWASLAAVLQIGFFAFGMAIYFLIVCGFFR